MCFKALGRKLKYIKGPEMQVLQRTVLELIVWCLRMAMLEPSLSHSLPYSPPFCLGNAEVGSDGRKGTLHSSVLLVLLSLPPGSRPTVWLAVTV